MAAPYASQSHSRWETFVGLVGPWQLVRMSAAHLPGTILSLLRTLSFGTLLSWDRFQSVWFARFWSEMGPLVREGAEVKVIPLLSGRVHNGSVVAQSEATSPGIGGTVLEIGAGSGMWVSLFSASHCSPSSKPGEKGTRSPITKIYGVEPNAGSHSALRAEVAAAGLEGVYEVVPVGIQDLLATGHVAPESVDCIVSVLCLCSIPDPERNIAELYKCLKPGGRWYVYEHVRVYPEQGRWVGLYQAFVNLIWPHFIGGCNIRRDTARYLKSAGPWTQIDLAQPTQESWFFTLPHTLGILTK